MLPPISLQQQAVLDSIKNGFHVICNSVAGSGKTTCILHIADNLKDRKILFLTYSARLRKESETKQKENNIYNIDIHSYHSFGYNLYKEELSKTDLGIEKIIDEDKKLISLHIYDLIILDESQDITPLLYRFIKKIQRDNKQRHQLVVFGDEKQCIFSYKGADARFLTLSNKIYNQSKEWNTCGLSQSYRITTNMANFLNYCMLNEPRIVSKKASSFKPRYIICDTFKKTPFEEIQYYLETLLYSPSDIFVLAPSVKNEWSPCRMLENEVKKKYKNKVPVYCPLTDESVLDDDIMRGKMIFSSFHQSKGLERKVVIVFGFDDFYFKYNKSANPNICPNELYVAVTRGLEHLSVFHHCENEFLPFLNQPLLKEHCEFFPHEIKIKKEKKNPEHKISVTKLLGHISEQVLQKCFKMLSTELVHPKGNYIAINGKVGGKCDDTFEDVCEITGTAVPSCLQYTLTGTMDVYNKYKNEIYERYKISNLTDTLKIKELLQISTMYVSKQSGYIHKTYQIKTYDWISKNQLNQCLKNIERLQITKNAQFETHIEILFDDKKIIGCIDCIHETNLYEFKCVKDLEIKHYLQLAVYMYMCMCNGPSFSAQHYYLHNILNGETIEIKNDKAILQNIISILINEKYNPKQKISDEDFLNLYLCQVE